MNGRPPVDLDDDWVPLDDGEAAEGPDDADLWFMPGPPEEDPDLLPPGPQPETTEPEVVEAWRAAEAGQAAHLAHVAARLGILDERLRRGPVGWRHRLALIEASELGWLTQDRIGLDRLSLYMALRVSSIDDPLEAAVTAARVAVAELASSLDQPGVIFAPIAMGGGGGLRTIGEPATISARSWPGCGRFCCA